MRTEESVSNSDLLGCAGENRIPPWAQHVRNELNGASHVSQRPFVVCRVLELLQSQSIVPRARENELDSSDEDLRAVIKAACTY